jgi:predicted nuclease of predicted toxin-antitoxin system
MKLLLDANISWRLTTVLKAHFKECLHVDYVGLASPPKDIDIWKFARLAQMPKLPSSGAEMMRG